MIVQSFKIFGERHTGTNALSSFVIENFNIKFLYYDYLGWKHRLAPNETEIQKFATQETIFLFTFRNPYTWLKAMHRDPYYYHYPKITELNFFDFVQFQIEDYENLIMLWNQKNSSYLEMINKVPISMLVKVEDFHNDQQSYFNKISSKIEFNGNFIPMDRYLNGRGQSSDKSVTESLTVPNLSREEIEVINRYLDKDLMKELNYNLLP
ncbi:MAG: hypothetical protein DBW96_02905 [SAR86 cluster bacterium]|uniref:Sulfotransferase family protein n=1 Tax=SAR86 cluster bacterium TaxID=2030880 RepID=A0A368BUB0_9GAMM|nr:MAG: hypothetical protein DBW96_02905 [SAR86 cluster bacterium]